MNWEIFSTAGYISVGLWLLVPVLWVLHLMIRPRRWLGHAALLAGIAALVLAEVNSSDYVARIQVDRSDEINEQMSAQAMARKAAEDDRAAEVANIRFAEDASGDFLDIAGLDDADRAYFESFGSEDTPEWKKQKQQRSDGEGETDDLEALIGASEEREGIEVAEELQEQPEAEPILMSDKDKTMADRLDGANLKAARLVLLLAALFVVFDYVRRLNSYNEAYFPLPVPSAWANALTEREPVTQLPAKPRRSVLDELRLISRRGEMFVYVTDDAKAAAAATAPMPRLPIVGRPSVDVIAVGDDPRIDNKFVFETVWFGRKSFVVSDTDRAAELLDQMLGWLTERRASRAHTRRAVHLVWDTTAPIPEATRQRFAALGRATGFTLLICKKPVPTEADA